MATEAEYAYVLQDLHIEIAKRDERIAALERIIATLSAEIDVQRPVVEAAQAHRNCIANSGSWTVANGNLHDAVDAYETTRAAQAEVKRG
jgi:hypothetical protein